MEDQNKAESLELDLLLDRGTVFKVTKTSWLSKLSKKKEREFFIKQPYLGTLDILSGLYVSMKVDEGELDKDPMGESKRLVRRSAKTCAMVVAVAVLNSKWKIKLFAKIYANYFMWHVTPQYMWKLAITINNMSNLSDFTNSIRLMSGARTTAPTAEILVEDPSKQD